MLRQRHTGGGARRHAIVQAAADFTKIFAGEIEKWGKVVKASA